MAIGDVTRIVSFSLVDRRVIRALALTFLTFVSPSPGTAQVLAITPMPASGDTSSVDYRDPSHWVCRPDAASRACTDVGIDGSTPVTASHREATDPPIDCFYVYPTASSDPTFYSGLEPDAAVESVVHAQASWLGARCRVFAPRYHQVTIAALKWELSQPSSADASEIGSPTDIPYRDVLAAWRDYLAHDNAGRGVVLVGHSQGARLLQRLIDEEFDGRAPRRLLVAAYLAGNSGLYAQRFRTIAPCGSADDIACFVAWSSYREGTQGRRLFGNARPGTTPVCVNPAAPGGGRGILKAVLAMPGAVADAVPSNEADAVITAECEVDAAGAVLRIRVEPGPAAASVDAALTPSRAGPAWGLHPHDIALVQGNLSDLIVRQSLAWSKKRADEAGARRD